MKMILGCPLVGPHVEVLLLDGVVGAGDHERVLAVPVAAVAVLVEARHGDGAAPVSSIIRSLLKIFRKDQDHNSCDPS